jgi:hypothetical protein
VVSEELGMEDCGKWLRTFITGVPIQFVPAGEPFVALRPALSWLRSTPGRARAAASDIMLMVRPYGFSGDSS